MSGTIDWRALSFLPSPARRTRWKTDMAAVYRPLRAPPGPTIGQNRGRGNDTARGGGVPPAPARTRARPRRTPPPPAGAGPPQRPRHRRPPGDDRSLVDHVHRARLDAPGPLRHIRFRPRDLRPGHLAALAVQGPVH